MPTEASTPCPAKPSRRTSPEAEFIAEVARRRALRREPLEVHRRAMEAHDRRAVYAEFAGRVDACLRRLRPLSRRAFLAARSLLGVAFPSRGTSTPSRAPLAGSGPVTIEAHRRVVVAAYLGASAADVERLELALAGQADPRSDAGRLAQHTSAVVLRDRLAALEERRQEARRIVEWSRDPTARLDPSLAIAGRSRCASRSRTSRPAVRASRFASPASSDEPPPAPPPNPNNGRAS